MIPKTKKVNARKMVIMCRRCMAWDLVTVLQVNRDKALKPTNLKPGREHSWWCKTLRRVGIRAKFQAKEVEMNWVPEGKKARMG